MSLGPGPAPPCAVDASAYGAKAAHFHLMATDKPQQVRKKRINNYRVLKARRAAGFWAAQAALEVSSMRTRLIVVLAVLSLVAMPAISALALEPGQGQAVITVLPKDKEAQVNIQPQDLRLKVGGKDASLTGLAPA